LSPVSEKPSSGPGQSGRAKPRAARCCRRSWRTRGSATRR
jgi:hypothetical protein